MCHDPSPHSFLAEVANAMAISSCALSSADGTITVTLSCAPLPRPKILVARGTSSLVSRRSSKGEGVANPACPARKMRPRGSSPSSKSANDLHHKNRCPWIIEKAEILSCFSPGCTTSTTAFHCDLQRRARRFCRLSVDCLSTS